MGYGVIIQLAGKSLSPLLAVPAARGSLNREPRNLFLLLRLPDG